MANTTYGLKEIKSELKHLSSTQIADLCLRLVKYKKENKELLAYLLFESHDQDAYVADIKAETGLMYSQLISQSYQMAKGVRKILRVITKQVKFMGSKQAEVELLMQFCKDYLDYVNLRSSYKPLRQILLRQLTKIKAAINKLDEDLQFDYLQDYNNLVLDADKKTSWVYKAEFLLE
ncbi:hypothetical protein [Mucilaginibacter ginkgonis]|uniref:Uncharacterized protein n=1 Tax=Mucilaginibacter ginkgonis TaxID=2682091 RepID=A0A6I4HVR7_9SPHI|nr:hypothetical protein [Mucilaginibacter ginkgonis]QQL50925.1 hypothetical protein GO620_005575 [Mucilaginibacter ginkgonis]